MEGKKEGRKERKEGKKNVNVFFMLKKNCTLPNPSLPPKNYKIRKGAEKNDKF